MFYLRGLLVSISVFVLLYVACSLLVCCVWRPLYRRSRRLAPSSAADVLYAVRTSPFVVSLLVVFGFSVPSFVRFEPRATGETLGLAPVFLAVVFAGFALVTAWRAWNAYAHTQRSIRDWTRGAARLGSRTDVDCFQGGNGAPPVALAGIGRPALVISEAASASLTPRELSRTVEHELAHLRARDNLKKLLLHACAFPGMTSLERAWLEAVEYSADSAAVHNESEALDLASALVKISRLSVCGTLPELASGLVEGPSSLLQARVQRLLEWRARPGAGTSSHNRLRLAMTMVLSVGLLVVNYPSLLRTAHVLTEFLVR